MQKEGPPRLWDSVGTGVPPGRTAVSPVTWLRTHPGERESPPPRPSSSLLPPQTAPVAGSSWTRGQCDCPSGPSSLNTAARHGGSRPAAPRADSAPQRVNAAPPLAGTCGATPALGSPVPLPRRVGDRHARQTIAVGDPRSREGGLPVAGSHPRGRRRDRGGEGRRRPRPRGVCGAGQRPCSGLAVSFPLNQDLNLMSQRREKE